MLVLGLTGSIGAGKSTVADMFAAAGASVFSADRAVHQLYEGAAVEPVGAAFPGVVYEGRVDRDRLAAAVLGDDAAVARLEAIVHPLVRQSGDRFVSESKAEGRLLSVLEIPLLLETGGQARVDVVVTVVAPVDTRRARVMARPGMTEARFDKLAARQMADDDKRRASHFMVDNGGTLAATGHQVTGIVRALAAAAAGR